jgi:hypothetical protein
MLFLQSCTHDWNVSGGTSTVNVLGESGTFSVQSCEQSGYDASANQARLIGIEVSNFGWTIKCIRSA